MNKTGLIKEITEKTKKAAALLSVMPQSKKNEILIAMAELLDKSRDVIKEANKIDLANAEKKGRNKAFLDRLRLDDQRIDMMLSMMRQVAELKDPVGNILKEIKRPNGLIIQKQTVPIGVIGIIYEARPNVTGDCISLCLKSGNAVILRGGTDAINSNKSIYKVLKQAARDCGLDEGAFILIEDTSREVVYTMLEAKEAIDLIIPRGGELLINEVVARSKIPVIKHYKGICHIYVDAEAEMDMAENICFNAKVQRPGVCNAMETMLVHEKIAAEFLPRVASRLWKAGVTLKGCQGTSRILGSKIEKVTDKDFFTEWLDLVLNIRVVQSLDEAIAHIARFGSRHSDAIVTENKDNATEFTRRVDSAAVYVNASTRFTDGGEFGKGAEIGISTDKLHARGPMGLEELCTYKYVIYGTGQLRI